MSLSHCDIVFREGICDHVFDDLRDIRHVRRRLQHGRTTRRDGTDKRSEQQLDRIIPRGYYQCSTERLADDSASGREHLQWCRHTCPTSPLPYLAYMRTDFPEQDTDFRHVCLLVRFVQICPQGIAKRLFPFQDSLLECLQI